MKNNQGKVILLTTTILGLILIALIAFAEYPPLFDKDYKPVNPAKIVVSSDKININTANMKELMMLEGIGKVRAQAITDYRSQIGYFKDVEEIKNVRGITSKIFENVKDKIEV